ncbi:MAG: DUF6600 domain-containing protein [Pelobium sp.]
MKSIIKKTATAFGIIVLFLSLNSTKAEANPNRGISLQVFYDELSYYGDWVNNPDYGYVWRPNVGRDFRPYYTNGHWVMTEYGNTWVSDYEWGWAPFHYGRWFYDDYDGWIWAPDTEWGPAWVSWRTGGGYYGWAPLGPRINININIGRRYYVPDNYWVFIPQRCIYYPSYGRYWEPRRNVYIINNTTIINNVYTNRNLNYYTGPRADDIRRATRQDVPVYRVADGTTPGSTRVTRDAVNIYRPDVIRDDKNAAPRTIASNSSRPNRASDNNLGRSNDGTGNSARREDANQSNRPSTIDRSARPDASSSTTQTSTDRISRPDVSSRPQPNTDNNRSTRSDAPNSRADVPTRTERSTDNSSSNQRSNSPAPAKQESRGDNNSRPQRTERSEPSAPRTVERSQPQQQSSRSSGTSSSESGRSSRPSRGNN